MKDTRTSSKLKAAEISKPTSDRNADHAVGAALRTVRVWLSTEALYQEFLIKTLDPQRRLRDDHKEYLRHRRVLESLDSFRILSLIWKESDFVTDRALDAAGLARTFRDNEGLSVYSLAVALVDDPSELSKMNSRIRSICLAAEYFGLIERVSHSQTRGSLRPTNLLHEFMISLSVQLERQISKLHDQSA